ncbi:hypothetical protein AVEN_265725-1 [Araneus ventricosus]|uniref:Uncharacterized protein n=1 Tax=Araneus ventricosus TaxID=182803 RepID=A0A4Y2FPC6_ARAVE|nr:hypothetical protein AVEN_265725-1 [Araneus ventricosus]
MTMKTPELVPLLQTSILHQPEDGWPPKYDLKCEGPTYTADLLWNQVSNMKTACPGDKILPLAHHCLKRCLKILNSHFDFVPFSILISFSDKLIYAPHISFIRVILKNSHCPGLE